MVSPEGRRILAELRASSTGIAASSVEESRRAWEEAVTDSLLDIDAPVEATAMGGVPGEWVSPRSSGEGGAVVYLHGGGFTAGSCRTHRRLAADIARAAGVPILVVDYRLAPEHPCPAAIDDAVQVYCGLLEHGFAGDRIVIGGDSAGAAIALAALVQLRDSRDALPAGACLLSPWLDLSLSGPTLRSHAERDPLTTEAALRLAALHYLAGRDPRDPIASPLFADLHGLPPLLVQTGGEEILQADATRLERRADEAHVECQMEIWEGMWHVWHAWADAVPEARQAITRVGEFVRRCLAST